MSELTNSQIADELKKLLSQRACVKCMNDKILLTYGEGHPTYKLNRSMAMKYLHFLSEGGEGTHLDALIMKRKNEKDYEEEDEDDDDDDDIFDDDDDEGEYTTELGGLLGSDDLVIMTPKFFSWIMKIVMPLMGLYIVISLATTILMFDFLLGIVIYALCKMTGIVN